MKATTLEAAVDVVMRVHEQVCMCVYVGGGVVPIRIAPHAGSLVSPKW